MAVSGEETAPLTNIIIPEEWSEAARIIAFDSSPPISFVCGLKTSGKTIFSRYLLNILLQRYVRVAYLDTDVGQTKFTPPGCLSLTVIDKITPETLRKNDRIGEDIGDGVLAMKVMRKNTIIKNNHVDYVNAERNILTKVVHPFIVPLRYSFQTKSKLYLILDFINGGHLFYHLYRQGIFSEDQAILYTAEIVSAVSHLHKSGIMHRDLKPENILMDADGHVIDMPLYSTSAGIGRDRIISF